MNDGFSSGRISRRYRRWLSKVLAKGRADLSPERSAIVFAPHQDDETLGCGGTIIKKKSAGARVIVAFATDGRGSHPGLIERDEMATLRQGEARSAAGVLGVPDADVVFFGLPDSRLSRHRDTLRQKAADILRGLESADVFVPYRHETPPDHRATYDGVMDALHELGRPTVVYEYPVWFWCHWPWAVWRVRGPRELASVMLDGLRLPPRMLRDFDCYVPVDDVLDRKREALSCHRSQMERLVPDVAYATLPDIAGGNWLACFFQGFELFRRTEISG